MKKLYTALILIFISVQLFSEEWNNSIGVGITFPGYSFNIVDSSIYNVYQYDSEFIDIGFIYNGFAKKGFSIKSKTDFGIGNFKKDGNLARIFVDNFNLLLSENLSLGYKFAISDKLSLVPSLILNVKWVYSEKEYRLKNDFGSNNESNYYNLIGGGGGFDFTGFYYISDKFFLNITLALLIDKNYNHLQNINSYNSFGVSGKKEYNSSWTSTSISFEPCVGFNFNM